MKKINMAPLLSPEWANQGESFLTTQYGAYIKLKTQKVQLLRLEFAENYLGLSFVITVDDVRENITIDKNFLSIVLPNDDEHIVEIILRNVDGNNMYFWKHPVIINNMLSDDGQVMQLIEDGDSFITFVGDSITAGEAMATDGNHPELSFPYLVAQELKKPLNRIAYGGTGLTANAPFQTPSAIDALWHVSNNVERVRTKTNLVVVNYGTNDFNYHATDESFAFGLRIYLLELIKRFHNARIILLIPFNGAFKHIIEKETQRFSCFEVVDTTGWLVDLSHVHPNIEEHSIIAKNILKGI